MKFPDVSNKQITKYSRKNIPFTMSTNKNIFRVTLTRNMSDPYHENYKILPNKSEDMEKYAMFP